MATKKAAKKSVRKVATKRVVRQVEKERAEFRQLISSNPNYFGTVKGSKLKAVKKVSGNTKYEQLDCLGFYPEVDLLEAILQVKLPYGYNGTLCTKGSLEYVRFFVDWDGDGDFDDPSEDVGLASVNVHDIADAGGPCLEATKPLSYALSVKLDPSREYCKTPKLVKVRAILSWETPPTPGDPNYPVVWGNVLEGWIQIRPRPYLLAYLKDYIDFKKAKINPEMLVSDLPVTEAKVVPPKELKQIYEKQDVPLHRFDFQKIASIAYAIAKTPSLLEIYQKDPGFMEIQKSVFELLKQKPQVKYEELGCVGLNYTNEQLMATLTVKKPFGYSGDLCSAGSHEYVAFWAYVYDKIEATCVWEHLGTAKVNVHDIPSLPTGGLKYAVYLPVDLSRFGAKCTQPKILKVRAILSWNSPPDPTDPEYTPAWGNRIDRLIQLRPTDIQVGIHKPYIWAAGHMAVEGIAGNAFTVETSTIGDGYANGPSAGYGYTANESPFGGTIAIGGSITFPPNNPTEAQKLKYKVQYHKVGTPGPWVDIKETFKIWRRIDSVPVGSMTQSPDSAGYYKFQKDLTLPTLVEVLEDVLVIWRTSKATHSDGLYELRVLVHQLGAPFQPGVPADHIASDTIKLMLDNTGPSAEISLDVGACHKFTVGDKVEGKFTATDAHIWRYSLWVEPTVATPPVITLPSPPHKTYPLLAAPGVTDEPFEVQTTSSTTPCGYIVKVRVRDRTIVNNHFPGHHKTDSVGLCLLEEE
ncbi:MAG: hypothetical protein WBP36_18000 [Thermoanaerobaculia bacterium]